MNTLRSTATRSKEVPATKAGRATFCAWRREWWSGVGLLITVLSFFILLLSIFLMLQKNLKKLEDLLMLDYTPAQVARPYQLLALGLNLSVLACAVPVVVWVRSKYLPMVRMLGEDYAAPGIWGMLLAGILVVGAVVLIDMLVIRHKVNGLWTQR